MYLVTAWKEFRGEHDRVPVIVNGRIFGIFRTAQDLSRARQQVWQRWVLLSQIDPDNAFELVGGRRGGPFLVHRSIAANQNERERSTAQAGRAKTSREGAPDLRVQPRSAGPVMSDDQLRALRKHKGMLTELPWQRRPNRADGSPAGSAPDEDESDGDGEGDRPPGKPKAT